jgi:hypothetical protein
MRTRSGARPDIAGTVGPHSAFLAFLLLALSQPYPWAATVLVDELYAGGFDRHPNFFGCAFTATELTMYGFESSNRWLRNPRALG